MKVLKPLSSSNLHKEQIKKAFEYGDDEYRKNQLEKKQERIHQYLKNINKIKPPKQPFNKDENIPIYPQKEVLEKIETPLDIDQVLKDYIQSEYPSDDEQYYFIDEQDRDYIQVADKEIPIDEDYEYDEEPLDDEYTAKTLNKEKAIKAFTGKDLEQFHKTFKFMETGYYKNAILEAKRKNNQVSHVKLNIKNVEKAIAELLEWEEKRMEPSEGLLFSDIDPSLLMLVTVNLKTPYYQNLGVIDVPLLHPILDFEDLEKSSLQMLLIVPDYKYDVYVNLLQNEKYIKKLKIMSLTSVMQEVGVKGLRGNVFEMTRHSRFKEKKAFIYQYDLLFCDASLSKNITAIFNKKASPKQGFRPVNEENCKEWIQNDLTHSKSFIHQGNTSFSFRIARTEWSPKKIIENISHFLVNTKNNEEVRNAYRKLVHSDIKSITIHTNNSIHKKIYENDEEPVPKSFKREEKFKKSQKK
ncbi:hypothetical protein ABK040_007136 [Willaertia magna]